MSHIRSTPGTPSGRGALSFFVAPQNGRCALTACDDPSTDRTTRFASAVASSLTTNHAAKRSVFVNLETPGDLKQIVAHDGSSGADLEETGVVEDGEKCAPLLDAGRRVHLL